MLDHLSEEPGPTRLEACNELFEELVLPSHPELELYKNISDNYIKQVIKQVVYSHNEGDLGSHAGWLYYYRTQLMEIIDVKIKKYTATKRRVQILVRCIGSVMILYQKTLHKRYAPEGDFEVECSKYWNPLIWNLNKQDTIRYRGAMNQKYN